MEHGDAATRRSRWCRSINNPSGGLGPRITAFPDFTTQVTSGNAATVNATTTNAGSLRWNSDGTPNGAGDATGGPTAWQATWQLGAQRSARTPHRPSWATTQFTPARPCFDGTYTITGQAFDDLGIAGDSRASVLPLNRSLPITVTGFQVGRNFNVGRLEFRWNQNPELDIIGYRVYELGADNQIGNGNDTLDLLRRRESTTPAASHRARCPRPTRPTASSRSTARRSPTPGAIRASR